MGGGVGVGVDANTGMSGGCVGVGVCICAYTN